VAEDHISWVIEVLVQPQPGLGLAQKPLQRSFALLDRGPSQIGAVELQEVERVKKYGMVILTPAQPSERCEPFPIAANSFAIDQAGDATIRGCRFTSDAPSVPR
jgi:hypothetical protein